MQPVLARALSAPSAPPSSARVLTSAARCPDLAGTVGNTPVLWIDHPFAPPGRGFWAKLEGRNPGGMKDRPGLHMIVRARQRGELEPGGVIVESTSGTLGLGLALAGIAYGHPVTVVTDPGMDPIVRSMLRILGVRMQRVEQPCPIGGWQEARRQRVAELLAADPRAYCPNQYDNPDNIDGYRPLALELAAQLGRIDTLVCSVGTGGHSAGIARVLREFFPQLRLIGVDSIGSTIFGQPARPRLMRGLGSSIHPRNVDYPAFDEVHWVAPGEAVWACRQLTAARFVGGGWSVGAVALVAGWLARVEPCDARIAAIFPDGPARYLDSIYHDDYCRRHGLDTVVPAIAPEEITDPGAQEVTEWTRCRVVRDPLVLRAGGE